MEDGRVLAIRHAIGTHGHIAATHCALCEASLHGWQQSSEAAPRVFERSGALCSALAKEQQPAAGLSLIHI
eukprot:7583828-Alexandrium_andersonii.AAC.1